MSRLSQAIRRHRQTRNERQLDRAFRMPSGSDTRADLSNLARWTR